RVNQPWQKNLLAKIDNLLARISRGDFGKFSNINNSISGNCDRAVRDRRSIHRYDDPRPNDHSPFTTLRHAATKRLHASWQSRGTVPRMGLSAVALANGDDLNAPGAGTWSSAGSNFPAGNFVDAIAPSWSRFHKIVRKQPPLDRQKSATMSSICASEILAA